MSSPHPAAVLFDMDGTLLDSEKLWTIGLQDLCLWLGHDLDPHLRARIIGMDQAATVALLHEHWGLPASGVAAGTDWLLRRMKELFAEGVVWQPGARELLSAVRAAGLPTALVTATGRELVDVIIGTIGPQNFDVTVCGDEVSRNKPDPEPYLTAAARLGTKPGDCLAIEDSPTGTESALAAGIPVLVVPGEVRPVPRPRTAIVDSLSDVDVAGLVRVHRRLTV